VLRTVVLPAYNESGYIATMIERTLDALRQRDDPFEVIVVDNASTDSTAEIVAHASKLEPRVRLLRHQENRLYAGSCLTGTRAARGERIFILDSDGQHDPGDVWMFDSALDRSDIAFGWRQRREETWLRLSLSRVLWLLARVYIGFALHDVNCGIRAFGRDYGDQLVIKHLVNLVNPELYVRAILGGFRVTEVEVRQESRKTGVSSQQLSKLWLIFLRVNLYLFDLRRELRAGVRAGASQRHA
jgi:dolichol-phosphate mannosyltransferase